jgi:hypothetical protein
MDEPVTERLVEVDGVPVRVRTERQRLAITEGEQWTDVVTILAGSPACGELTIDVVAGARWMGFGKNRIVTGVTAFDDHYVVTTSDERIAAWWFGPAEAEALAATYDPTALTPFALRLAPGVITLVAGGVTTIMLPISWQDRDAPQHQHYLAHGSPPLAATHIDEAIHAAGFIAGRNLRLAARWRDLLAPHGLIAAGPAWRTDDQYALVVERGRTKLVIDFPWRLAALASTGLRTRLAVRWPVAGAAAIWPRTWSRRQRPRVDGDRALHLAAPWHGVARGAALDGLSDIGGALAAVGVDWLLVGDGLLAIGWEDVEEDPARLARALGLLARWAEQTAAASGPYR